MQATAGGKGCVQAKSGTGRKAALILAVIVGAWLTALAVLMVTQIPDAAAEVDADATHTERLGLFGGLTGLGRRNCRLSSEKLSATKRYKKRYKRELLGITQKRKCLPAKDLR